MAQKNHANVYDATLIILNSSDGGKYLYDVIGIKKNTVLSDGLSSDLATRKGKNGVIEDNISYSDIDVNSESDDSVSSIKEDGSIGGYSKEYVDNFVNAYVNGGMQSVVVPLKWHSFFIYAAPVSVTMIA